MKLYEHHGKDLFAKAGIPVPKGAVICDPGEIRAALGASGLPCVLKAQLLRGGRGKAGLIQTAADADEARRKAEAIFAAPQRVRRILVEEKLAIAKEFYLAATFDAPRSAILLMASSEGGMDIEDAAARAPARIVRECVNPLYGLMPFNLRNLVAPLGLDKETSKAFSKVAGQVFDLFRRSDAMLVEINPLALTTAGALVAADAKVEIDDHALYRQSFERTGEEFANAIEFEAAQEGIPYVQLDGDIGLMCAGAGLTNTVCDLIRDFGGRPANFLEFGGPNYRKAVQAMRLALKGNPRVILIVTFGTIARADVMAEGIAEAIRELKPDVPIVTAIRGTNEEQARATLRAAGLDPLMDTEEAVRRAVALAKGGAR